jgi:hypothetical protein
VNLSLKNAINAADLVARAVWTACGAPTVFGWRDGLGRVRPGVLAQFAAARPDATAEALYRFAVADDPDAKGWREIPPALRCAVEVFRGTFLALYREIEVAKETSYPREIIYGVGRQGSKSARSVSVLEGAAGHVGIGSTGEVFSMSPPAPGNFETEIVTLEREWANDDGRPKSKRGRR